jgi:hypothetical protein
MGLEIENQCWLGPGAVELTKGIMASGFTCKLVDLQQEIHDVFHRSTKLCHLGLDKNCKHLSLVPAGSKQCMTRIR